MAARCPECGYKLKFYNVRAECPKCGTNIPNYKWEEQLERDADNAEEAYARLHYKLANFKSSLVGTKLRIVRLVMTFAPLIALVLPLYSFNISLPFYEKSESLTFLSFILDYLTKTDIGSVIKLTGAPVTGRAAAAAVIACALMLLAVVCGVLNFFVLLISGIKMRCTANIVLNAAAALFFGLSSLFFARFTSECAALGGGILTGGTVGFGFAAGVILFGANFLLNIAVGKSLKKEAAEKPSIEEFVKNELAELRAQREE